jgi:hypothetical protein
VIREVRRALRVGDGDWRGGAAFVGVKRGDACPDEVKVRGRTCWAAVWGEIGSGWFEGQGVCSGGLEEAVRRFDDALASLAWMRSDRCVSDLSGMSELSEEHDP